MPKGKVSPSTGCRASSGDTFRFGSRRVPVQVQAPIVEHRRIAPDHWLLTLHAPVIARRAKVGQFVHVLCGGENGDSPHLLLRRPFSLLDVDRQRGTIALIYKVVGLGTEALSRRRVGEALDTLGPLGNSFNGHPRQAIIIGGGVGIPPLYWLAKDLMQGEGWRVEGGRPNVEVFLGAGTKDYVLCVDRFRKLGLTPQIATDDGSLGFRGLVTAIVRSFLTAHHPSPPTILYACGPTPMLQACARLAEEFGLPCQVSLEERMGCAMACCMGCVVEVATEPEASYHRFQRVCTEGPVFDANEIAW